MGSLIKQCRSFQAIAMFYIPVVKQECYQHTKGFILNTGGQALVTEVFRFKQGFVNSKKIK